MLNEILFYSFLIPSGSVLSLYFCSSCGMGFYGLCGSLLGYNTIVDPGAWGPRSPDCQGYYPLTTHNHVPLQELSCLRLRELSHTRPYSFPESS